MIRSLVLTAMAFTFTLVSGCAGSPQSSFYTLSPEPGKQALSVGASPKAITIVAVSVPEMVDRPQFVLRVNENQVSLDEFARWADPLKSQIRRVIAADLALQFPDALVYPNSGAPDPASTYQVSVDVQSFESVTGEAATVSVLWSVKPLKGVPVSGRTIVRELTKTAGYDALVSAHSRALAAVSSDIAAAIHSTQ
jgi:uncharacterized lipoprotein YmbA